MLKRWGGAIRRRRVGAGISQAQLAEAIHCSVEQVDKFEKGLREPYIDGVIEIAQALRYPVADLFRDAKLYAHPTRSTRRPPTGSDMETRKKSKKAPASL